MSDLISDRSSQYNVSFIFQIKDMQDRLKKIYKKMITIETQSKKIKSILKKVKKEYHTMHKKLKELKKELYEYEYDKQEYDNFEEDQWLGWDFGATVDI